MKKIFLTLVLAFLLTSTLSFHTVAFPPGLISYWSFDYLIETETETKVDDPVSHNDGVLNDGAVWTTGGKVGGALSFDGAGDYVDCGTDSSLDFGTGPFTFELWVNYRTLNGEQILIEKYVETMNSTTCTGWSLTKVSDNLLVLGAIHIALFPFVDPGIQTDNWYHVAVTRNDNTFTLYWNGDPISSGTVATDLNLDTTSSLKIGHRGHPSDTPGSNDYNGYYLNGFVDEVAIHNRALASAEIMQHYQNGLQGLSYFASASYPPIAVDDTATTNENLPVTIPVLANDTDPDGDPLSITAVSDPVYGSAIINGNGTITYIPDLGFIGSDSFTYTISDSNGETATAVVDVSIDIIIGEDYYFVHKWGTYGTGDGQFNNPAGVAIDGFGNVYVADYHNERIQKFTSTGSYLTQWGSRGTGNDQLSGPFGIAIDSFDDVYVVDSDIDRIHKFTSTGGYLTQWGSHGADNGQFDYPITVAIDGFDNVYVADSHNDRIQKFTSTGDYLTQWGASGSGNGQFQWPGAVAADNFGNVYVADVVNQRIQKFTSDGVYLTQWGTPGGDDGQFNYPFGIAVDSYGNVYVTDTYNHRIQKFSSNGAFITKWGTYGHGDGQFDWPYAISINSTGDVYVADFNNHRIQMFSQTSGQNTPPVAMDDTATTNKNTPVTIPVLANDTDPDGDPLSITEVSYPYNGSATINGNNTITYTPDLASLVQIVSRIL